MTETMEHLHVYLHLEQYLKDLRDDLGEELFLQYLALAIEQLSPQEPKLRRVA